MAITEDNWKQLQKHLDYTDEEMKIFRADPRNLKTMSIYEEKMKDKTVVVEVIESHGCDGGHKAGDKFYFDGRGVGLLTKLCPNRACIFALSSMAGNMIAVAELMYAGVDPNKMMFRRFGCSDVGLMCGGWGHTVMEVRVEDRKKTK
jgi:uncharacterized repeat protein (TIGR04076 family)